MWVRVLACAGNKTPREGIPDLKSYSSMRIIIENSFAAVLCSGVTAALSQHQGLIQNRMKYMHIQDPCHSNMNLIILGVITL